MKMKIAVAALAILFAPALAIAQKTSYDFDKGVDFTTFKTYALKDGTKVGQKLIDCRTVSRSWSGASSSCSTGVSDPLAADRSRPIAAASAGSCATSSAVSTSA